MAKNEKQSGRGWASGVPAVDAFRGAMLRVELKVALHAHGAAADVARASGGSYDDVYGSLISGLQAENVDEPDPVNHGDARAMSKLIGVADPRSVAAGDEAAAETWLALHREPWRTVLVHLVAAVDDLAALAVAQGYTREQVLPADAFAQWLRQRVHGMPDLDDLARHAEPVAAIAAQLGAGRVRSRPKWKPTDVQTAIVYAVAEAVDNGAPLESWPDVHQRVREWIDTEREDYVRTKGSAAIKAGHIEWTEGRRRTLDVKPAGRKYLSQCDRG